MRAERHQQREPSFPGRGQSMEPCPDCNLEERLNAVCQPAFNASLGVRRTAGCSTCDGTGHVPKAVRPRRQDETGAEYRARVYRDPYEEGAFERVVARLGKAGQTSSPLTPRSAQARA